MFDYTPSVHHSKNRNHKKLVLQMSSYRQLKKRQWLIYRHSINKSYHVNFLLHFACACYKCKQSLTRDAILSIYNTHTHMHTPCTHAHTCTYITHKKSRLMCFCQKRHNNFFSIPMIFQWQMPKFSF